MAHLHKKIKKGHAYYYLRETRRIGGRPQVVNQVYLGSADRILSVFMGEEEKLPKRFSSKEFGSILVLHALDRELELAERVDRVVPRKRRSDGPSCGELLLYAVINRAIAPRSKRQLRGWYEKTDIQSLRPVKMAALSPQNFWNHWDRIGQQELERIVEGFFEKLHERFPSRGEHFLFDTTNFYSYLDSRTPSELARRGHNKAGKHHLRQVGLALITERSSGLPIYYRLYPGNQHDARFFELHIEEILGKLKAMGGQPKELTLIFDKGMNAEGNIGRIDEDQRLHFITSYSPYFAPELATVPLKHFQPLPCKANERILRDGELKEQILYWQSKATFWGRQRQVLITFNPKTFRKKRHELREKLERLRQELYELRRKHREGQPHWKNAQAVRAAYERLCETLHLNPKFYQLSFFKQQGRPAMAFSLNRYQIEAHIRRLAKTILITDHHDWSPRQIYEAYMDRHIIEDQFRKTKCPFQVAFMPQYHWTDSKVRIHAFVCIAALSYLSLLRNRLAAAGLSLSVREIMEQMRSLRSAIYWIAKERKPRRILEEPNATQLAILQALGYQVKDGRVLQH
jgi:transposase